MAKPLSDYALVGDTRTTALVARDGSVDFLCWPRHDSPALLLRLLDEDAGGAASLAIAGMAPAGRSYAGSTNVLDTCFEGAAGRARLTDLMPVFRPAHQADTGPDGDAQSRLVRILTCEEGVAEGAFTLAVTPEYGRERATARPEHGRWVMESASAKLAVSTSGEAEATAEGMRVRFRLRAGEQVFLALIHPCDGMAEPPRTLAEAGAALEQTLDYWREWSGRIEYDGLYRDAVVRSALVLKLLTYSPTGGIVAAATTSLPEAMPGNRNYDYRYSWVRDASFTVTAFCALGLRREAAEYIRFLRNANDEAEKLELVYGIEGPIPEEQELSHLPGYAGVGPVRIGNAADGQAQHDIYGEFLVALHAYLDATDYRPPEPLRSRLPKVVGALANAALRHRDEPDNGIWEIRGEPRHLQHSKAMLWVALDKAACLAERIPEIDRDAAARWRDAAAGLRAEYEAKCWSEAKEAYAQSYGSDVLDASVLRTVLFGALEPTDPRTLSTLDAVDRELADGDLVYRYRMDDGQDGQEGTFTACAFWRVGALALAGRTAAARASYERLLGRCNDVGLFAEEIDAATGEQRGNLPQAFTHMCVISHAIRLRDCIARFGVKD